MPEVDTVTPPEPVVPTDQLLGPPPAPAPAPAPVSFVLSASDALRAATMDAGRSGDVGRGAMGIGGGIACVLRESCGQQKNKNNKRRVELVADRW